MKDFYHLFANGSDAKNFIICKADYVFQFNLIGISSLSSKASVVAFSLEDTHLHALLHGTKKECIEFKRSYESGTLHHITATRGSKDNVELKCSLYLIDDEKYLMNASCYIVIQPTKDGKKVMPYDYFWGTGSMYFRSSSHIPIWLVKDDGTLLECCSFSELPYKEKRMIAGSHVKAVPENWKCCNGLLLPSNYVDVTLFESIFGTPNCFRVFCSGRSSSQDMVTNKMADTREVQLEDSEARQLCRETCLALFGKEGSKYLNSMQRISLARELRRKYHMSTRQISTLCRLPREELTKYL